jgi:hypothetical protein
MVPPGIISARRLEPESIVGDSPDWVNRCIVDDKGRIIANLANAMVALRSAPEFSGLLRYDEMLAAPLLCGPTPVFGQVSSHSLDTHGNAWRERPVSDANVSGMQEWLQLAGRRLRPRWPNCGDG